MKELSNIYHLYIDRHSTRSNFVEQAIGFDPEAPITIDDKRNEPSSYETVFKNQSDSLVGELYEDLLRDMRGKLFEECDDQIAGLRFLQMLIATAMWKYHITVSEKLKKFARDFDRLDALTERQKLYNISQEIIWKKGGGG